MHFFNSGSKMVASKTRGGGREIDEAQAGQQFRIFLLQPPPRCWDYRVVPQDLAHKIRLVPQQLSQLSSTHLDSALSVIIKPVRDFAMLVVSINCQAKINHLTFLNGRILHVIGVFCVFIVQS